MPCLLAYNIRMYSKVEDYETENKTCVDTCERKWRQPQLQLHLDTKFRGRRELGLPTLSAAVHPRKMMPRMMFQAMQTFCGLQIY